MIRIAAAAFAAATASARASPASARASARPRSAARPFAPAGASASASGPDRLAAMPGCASRASETSCVTTSRTISTRLRHP